MDFQLSVVLDKAQFEELVHEESLGNGVVRPKPSGLVAIPSWARPSVVAGGATCALKRALVQAGIEAKSARQSPPFWGERLAMMVVPLRLQRVVARFDVTMTSTRAGTAISIHSSRGP